VTYGAISRAGLDTPWQVVVSLWGVTRAVRRSTLGALSTFQLLLYVTMGDLVQQGITQQDYSVTGGVLAASTFAILTATLSYANQRWPATRPVIHGSPVVILRDGEPVAAAMRAEGMSAADLFAAARGQGIRRLGDVQLAVLEADGKISFFTASSTSEGAPETAPAS
jgi:uncharacterized membrane protein YcaP (DUF421 family)